MYFNLVLHYLKNLEQKLDFKSFDMNPQIR